MRYAHCVLIGLRFSFPAEIDAGTKQDDSNNGLVNRRIRSADEKQQSVLRRRVVGSNQAAKTKIHLVEDVVAY